MKLKTVKVDDDVREILLRSRIEDTRLTLSQQLPREQYQRVTKVIEAAGGKWNRKEGCHVFPQDVKETLDLDGDTEVVVNIKRTYQFFETPDELANRMVGEADIHANHDVLEPSAGRGAIVKAIHRAFPQLCVSVLEAEKTNREVLCKLSGIEMILHSDFLTWSGDKYDRILMNPPFDHGSDIKHIKHALTFLNPGGRLVALCANGPRQQEELKPLASEWIELPPGTFAEQGTGVNVAMLVIDA